MNPATEPAPTPTADTPPRSRPEAPPGRALTPHDLWVGVATRAQGMAADHGAAFDQQWLSKPGDPGALHAARLAVLRALGLPDDSVSGATQAAYDDARSSAELAEAYLAEYALIRGVPDNHATGECPWCGALSPECLGGRDAVRLWFICSAHAPHLTWGVLR